MWENTDKFYEAHVPSFDEGAGFTADFLPTKHSKVLDYFLAYLDEEIIIIILKEANAFYRYCVFQGLVKDISEQKPFVDVTVEELYSFLALVLAMPHTKKQVMCKYWSLDEVDETPLKYMSRNRFRQILQFLHFRNNENPNENDRF